MPAFVAAWLVGFSPVLTATIFQLLTSLGIGIATYTGVSVMLDQLHGFVVDGYGGLPAAVVGILALAKVDAGINLMLSGVTAKMTLQGLLNGSFKRFMVK